MDRTDIGDVEDDIRAEARAEIHSEPIPGYWFGTLCQSLGLSVGTAKLMAAIGLGVVLGSSFSVAFGLDILLSETNPLLLVGGYLLFIIALVVLVGTIDNPSGNKVGDRMG